MRSEKQMNAEIRKLRIVLHSQKYSETAKEKAWAMMLAVQWCKTTPETCPLTPLDLCGISADQATAVRALSKREK